MEILTSPAQVMRLNNFPERQSPTGTEIVRGQPSQNTQNSLRATIIDEQSSQKASTRRQALDQQRLQPISITVQQNSASTLRRLDLPGLPQLEHGISSSPFLAQQISQLQQQIETQDAIHEAASNAYETTLQRSIVVMGFQGGSGFLI